ncbi:MAG: M20/M25/M40 family metallo-hydrolase [Oligoflexia bacterium]|nr:M20/M25/M40 family metallo-hydrolase [Oligoflexia bacterium]
MENSLVDTLSILETLVGIKSVFPNEQEVSAWISRRLETLGFSVAKVFTDNERPNLVATLGKAKTYLGFYGHMDTVPPAADYVRDPFTVHRDGDILQGLGVCDMKGGLTCILQLAEWATKRKLPLKLVFGVDEEDISKGAHDLVNSGFLNDIGFMIVAESGQIENFDQPISVSLGRKGRVVLQFQVQGRAAHAAEPHKGVNAIEKAAHLIGELGSINLGAHRRLGSSTLVVQEITARASSFSVPDLCEVVVSLLSSPGVNSAKICDDIRNLAAKLNIKLQIAPKPRHTPYGEAYEIDTQNQFYRRISDEILTPLGVTPFYTPSVADENVFANRLKIPVLTMGVIGGGDHTKDEWAKLSSYETLISTYRNVLELWHQ